MLLAIKSHLNLADPVHATFLAVCLTGFFGLLRKANMLLKGVARFNPLKHLRRSDIVFYPGWALLSTAGLKPSSLVNVSLLFHYLSSQATHCALILHYSMLLSLCQPPCLDQPSSCQYPQVGASYHSHMANLTAFLSQWPPQQV